MSGGSRASGALCARQGLPAILTASLIILAFQVGSRRLWAQNNLAGVLHGGRGGASPPAGALPLSAVLYCCSPGNGAQITLQ